MFSWLKSLSEATLSRGELTADTYFETAAVLENIDTAFGDFWVEHSVLWYLAVGKKV